MKREIEIRLICKHNLKKQNSNNCIHLLIAALNCILERGGGRHERSLRRGNGSDITCPYLLKIKMSQAERHYCSGNELAVVLFFMIKCIRAIFIGYNQIFHSHKQARNAQKYIVKKYLLQRRIS